MSPPLLRGAAALALSSLLLHAAPAPAQTSGADGAVIPTDSSLDHSEYGGVVTRQVISSLGHYFHARFVELWQAKENVETFNLFVKEQPYPRGGTEVQVIFGDTLLFSQRLPGNINAVMRLCEEAAEISATKVVELNLQAQLFRDADLAPTGF